MYNVSKGPSKIVAQTRRGISQNIDRLEMRRDSKKSPGDNSEEDFTIVPRPVFHSNGNMKRPIHQSNKRNKECLSPQHEEIIRFINESWNNVYEQTSPTSSPDRKSSSSPPTVLFYNDGEPNTYLQDFKAFDLESWWGKRLFMNITKSL